MVLLIASFLMLSGISSRAQLPELTVRFNNPQFDCDDLTYCLDVEFLADVDNRQLFGINVRFFYDDAVLEFIGMGDFAQGYAPYDPNPPIITNYGPASGAAFGFPVNHAAEFVNGAVQITPPSSIYLSSTVWTKLFSICFSIDDPEAFDSPSFCPSVVWDLKENQPNVGFITGSNGVVMSVVIPPNQQGATNENVVQFNWDYDNEPNIPYGYPEETICIPTICAGDYDFGDAPEGLMAYPELGVPGAFPTCFDQVGSSYIQHNVYENSLLYFGAMVDGENDGNAGLCNPFGTPYNHDECFNDGDAGLLFPVTHTLTGSGYSTCTNGDSVLTTVLDTINWGTDLDIQVTNNTSSPAYVNILIDWNRNGIWDYDPTTKAYGKVIPEYCLVNFMVPPSYSGPLSGLNPPPIHAGPHFGHMWARFTLSDVPVNALPDNGSGSDWDGSGIFEAGETEDYLVYVQPKRQIPLSDWALVIGGLLIAVYTLMQFRKNS